MSDERRKFMRFDIPLNVKFAPSRGFSMYTAGQTKDFSREGFRMVTEKFNHEPPTAMKFKIRMPGGKTTVDATGEALWKKKVDRSWHLGVQLREINTEAKAKILECAYDSWRAGIRA